MQVADRFGNRNSASDLPSSAQVLAILAAAGADDATVQQAAARMRPARSRGRRAEHGQQQGSRNHEGCATASRIPGAGHPKPRPGLAPFRLGRCRFDCSSQLSTMAAAV